MYVKKKFTTILKIVVVCLVVVCGVYCYLCGGISKAVDNVKNGNYFTFEQEDSIVDGTEKIEVAVCQITKHRSINKDDEALYGIYTLNKKQYNKLREYCDRNIIIGSLDYDYLENLVKDWEFKKINKLQYEKHTPKINIIIFDTIH